METYNPHRTCPKCGNHFVEDIYCRQVVPHTPEHIKRTCQRCRYVWNERPLS